MPFTFSSLSVPSKNPPFYFSLPFLPSISLLFLPFFSPLSSLSLDSFTYLSVIHFLHFNPPFSLLFFFPHFFLPLHCLYDLEHILLSFLNSLHSFFPLVSLLLSFISNLKTLLLSSFSFLPSYHIPPLPCFPSL